MSSLLLFLVFQTCDKDVGLGLVTHNTSVPRRVSVMIDGDYTNVFPDVVYMKVVV